MQGRQPDVDFGECCPGLSEGGKAKSLENPFAQAVPVGGTECLPMQAFAGSKP